MPVGFLEIIEKGMRHYRELFTSGIHRTPVTLDREALDVQQGDLFRHYVNGQGVTRQYRNSQSADHGLFNGFITAQFHTYPNF